MNNLRKRVFSLILSGAMTLSMAAPFTVFAEGAESNVAVTAIAGQQGASSDEKEENTTSEITSNDNGTEENEAENPAQESPVKATTPSEPAGVAAEDGVARVGGSYYATLPDAVAAAEAGETITLLKDVPLSEAVSVGKDLDIVAQNDATVTSFRGEGYPGPLFELADGVLKLGGAGSDNGGYLVLDGGANWLVEQIVTDEEGRAVRNEQGEEQRETVSAESPALPDAYDGNEAAEAALITIAKGELYVGETVTLQNNHSSTDGGAIMTNAGEKAKIHLAGRLTNNASDGNGGGYSGNGSLVVYDTAELTGNYAAGDGGAVCLRDGGKADSIQGAFTGNASDGNGGALWLDGAALIQDGIFTGNRAAQGGALYAAASEEANAIRIAGGIFAGNEAGTGADAVLVPDEAPSQDGWVTVSGQATFGEAYLGTGKCLAVAGGLSGSVNLKVAGKLEDGREVVRGNDYTLTQGDLENITLQSSGYELKLADNAATLQNAAETTNAVQTQNEAAAASESKAYFNDTAYATLDEAVAALNASSAAEKTLVLAGDTTLSQTISLSSGRLTISSQGDSPVTVTRASGFNASAMLRVTGGELIMENVKFDGGAA